MSRPVLKYNLRTDQESSRESEDTDEVEGRSRVGPVILSIFLLLPQPPFDGHFRIDLSRNKTLGQSSREWEDWQGQPIF